jgi:putative spermidine/putrescine transport system permease protein
MSTAAPGRGTGEGGQRWLLAPAIGLLAAVFFLPLAGVLPAAFGLSTGGPSGFARLLDAPVYFRVVVTTVRISVETTALTLVVAYPLAWAISRARGRRRVLLGLLVLVPFLTSVLVRTFAWLAILGQKGLVNGLLTWLGLIGAPLDLLFTEAAVVLALVHVTIPMMVFPLLSVMHRIDDRTLMVAETLGAGRLTAWRRVLVPLTLPGIRSGVVIVFLSAMASFIAPAMLGGRRQSMLAQIIQSEIDTGSDWGFAAALGIVLAAVAIASVGLFTLAMRPFARWQRPRATTAPALAPAVPDLSILRRPVARRGRPRAARLAAIAGRVAGPAYLVLVSIYILLPLVVLFPVSFSAADVLVFPPPALSTRWFDTILGSREWLGAALTSLRIGLLVAAATVVIAVAAAIGMGRRGFGLRWLVEAAFLSPLTIPSVVFALGAFLVFARVGLVDTELGIALAHTVLVFPVVYLVVAAVHGGIDPQLERAAQSLGASRPVVMRRVVVPLMMPGIAAGALLALLLSFDESVASIFLSDLAVKTLPRRLWEGIRFNTSPEAAAVSALLLVFTCVVVALAWAAIALGRRRGGPALFGSATGSPPAGVS